MSSGWTVPEDEIRVRFVASGGRDLLRDPRAIPHLTLNYARYDLVLLINRLMELTGLSESILERAVAKFLAAPARRFLRMKRSVDLLVSEVHEIDGVDVEDVRALGHLHEDLAVTALEVAATVASTVAGAEPPQAAAEAIVRRAEGYGLPVGGCGTASCLMLAVRASRQKG